MALLLISAFAAREMVFGREIPSRLNSNIPPMLFSGVGNFPVWLAIAPARLQPKFSGRPGRVAGRFGVGRRRVDKGACLSIARARPRQDTTTARLMTIGVVINLKKWEKA